MSLSFLVLSEDGSRFSFDVTKAFVVEILKFLDPATQTHKVLLTPVNHDARAAVTANKWKSRNPSDDAARVTLVRAIAAKLREPDGYVAFHFDGDHSWNAKEPSPHWGAFAKEIVSRVEALLHNPPLRGPQFSSSEAWRCLNKLLVLVPHYSIESWLYQNTERAIEVCKAQHRGAHREAYESILLNRASLDTVLKPKEVFCVGSSHNRTLAKSFPTREVAAAGASFSAAVLASALLDDIERALKSTYS